VKSPDNELHLSPLETGWLKPPLPRLLGGKVLLQFFGEVTYDIFGVRHFSRYFGTWNHKTRAFRVDKHEAD
jgi:hypothetical protein